MVSVLSNIFCSINFLPVVAPLHFEKEELKLERKQMSKIVKDMALNFKNGKFISQPDNDICAGMRKSVLEIYNSYKETLYKHAAQLSGSGKVDNELQLQQAYSSVVKTILDDLENLHWGRLSMVFTLLAILAEDQRSKKRDFSWEQYNQLLMKIFKYKKIDAWINKNGGWDGFLEHINMKSKNKVEEFLWLSTLGLWTLTFTTL